VRAFSTVFKMAGGGWEGWQLSTAQQSTAEHRGRASTALWPLTFACYTKQRQHNITMHSTAYNNNAQFSSAQHSAPHLTPVHPAQGQGIGHSQQRQAQRIAAAGMQGMQEGALGSFRNARGGNAFCSVGRGPPAAAAAAEGS